MKKTIYYSNLSNDDFAGNHIKQKPIPADYVYITKKPLRKTLDFVLHHIVVTPIIFLFQKTVFAEKIVNRKVLRPYLKTGFYLYGNHTRSAGDAFTPNLITFPRKAYIITNPDAVSIPVIKHLVQSLGGFPLPNDRAGMQNFYKSLLDRSKNNCITIYPEAHIWPYYTKIRPFKSTSFKYAVVANKPVFCFTVTYKKRKIIPFVKTVVYVDGPFFPDQKLSCKQNQNALCGAVYNAMLERSKNSDYNYYNYVKS